MPDLIQFVYECGDREITVVATCEEEAFDKAEREAAALNLHDERLRLVDEFPFDPSGGDGDQD